MKVPHNYALRLNRLKIYPLIFGSIFILSLTLRLINLGREIRGGDGGHILVATTMNLGELFREITHFHAYPPGTFVLVHFWTEIFGNSIPLIRLYFVCFGVGLTILAYFLGKELLDERLGLTAFFLSALSPFLIWTSQYTRSFADSGFFIVLSSLFFLKILRSGGNTLYFIGYILSSMVSIYMFYFAGLILIAQNLCLLLEFSKFKKHYKKWILSQGIILSLYLPGLYFAIYQFFLSSATLDKGRALFWQHCGFWIAGIHVGGLIKTIGALIGFDPLLTESCLPFKIDLRFFSIALMVLLLGCGYLILKKTGNFENSQIKGKSHIWAVIILIFVPVVMAFIVEKYMHLAVKPRYFAAPHLFFIVFVTALTMNPYRKKLLAFIIIFYIGIFASRAGSIYRPEIEYKEAFEYINHMLEEDKSKVFLSESDSSFLNEGAKKIIFGPLIERDNKTGKYLPLERKNSEALESFLGKTCKVVLYRHGMIEPFGIYEVINKWFLDHGFELVKSKKFHGIIVDSYFKDGQKTF